MIDRSICAKSISIPSNRRIIAISDIHANLHIFQKLLKQIQFDSTLDELFLVGDLLEKGQQNMETLSYLMKLSQDSHVHLMLGNCDFVCKISYMNIDWIFYMKFYANAKTVLYMKWLLVCTKKSQKIQIWYDWHEN